MSTSADNAQETVGANEGADSLLFVNNIEVIYDHVILVLKGVSLEVPKAVSSPFWVPMVLGKRRR